MAPHVSGRTPEKPPHIAGKVVTDRSSLAMNARYDALRASGETAARQR
jgi:hypothetical protein